MRKSEYNRPDPAVALALAGEIYRCLSLHRRPEDSFSDPRYPWDDLHESTVRALGAGSLSEYFSISGAGKNNTLLTVGAEDIPVMLESLAEKRASLGREIKTQVKSRKKTGSLLDDIQLEKERLKTEYSEIQRLFRAAKDIYAESEKKYLRLKAKRRDQLAALKLQLERHTQSLKNQGRSAIESRVPTGEAPKKRSEYHALKAKYDLAKAGLKMDRANLDTLAADLSRLTMERDRLADRLESLAGEEAAAYTRFDEISERLSYLGGEWNALVSGRTDLRQARRDWKKLRSYLLLWSRDCRRLEKTGRSLSDFDFNREENALVESDSKLLENNRRIKLAASRIEQLSPDVDSIEKLFQDFESLVLSLSRELDRKTVLLKQAHKPAEQELEELSARLQKIRAQRDQLLDEKNKAGRKLKSGLKELDILRNHRRQILSFQAKVSAQAVAAIRSKATHRAALSQKQRKLHGQLSQLHGALPPLIGCSVFLKRCLITGALRLTEAENELGHLKEQLASAHDRLTRPVDAGDEKRLDDIFIEASSRQDRLSGLDFPEEAVSRLPRQLAALRAAIKRARRISKLEEDCRLRENEIGRLEDESRTREDDLLRKKQQLSRLTMEKERLEEVLRLAQEKEARLKQEKAELAKAYDEKWEKAGRLAHDRTRLLEARRRDRQVFDQLTADRKKLIHAYKKSKSDLEELSGRLNNLEQELDDAREETANLTGEKDRLETTIAENQEEIERLNGDKTRLAEAHRQAQASLRQLAEDKARLEEAHKRSLAELQQVSEDKKQLELDNRKNLEEIARLAEERQKIVRAYKKRRHELARLGRDRDRLLAYYNQSRKKLAGLAGDRERLLVELNAFQSQNQDLTSHLHDDVYPLLNTLGLALVKGQARLVRSLKQEESNRQEIEALSLLTAQLESGLKDEKETSMLLALALAALGREQERRDQDNQGRVAGLEARVSALNSELEELEADHLDSINLYHRQAEEIQDQREKLAELLPLLEFFIQRIDLWAAPDKEEAPAEPSLADGSETLVLLLHLLRQENETLKEKLAVLSDENLDLRFKNDHLDRSRQAVKSRLEQLLPLFSFLWKAWLRNVIALTESQARQRRTEKRLEALNERRALEEARVSKLTARLASAEEQMTILQEEAVESSAALAEAERLHAEFKDLYDKARREADSLREERNAFSIDLQDTHRELEILGKGSNELRLLNLRLASDNKKYRAEAETLRNESAAFAVALTDQTGRAEAAWAAFAELADQSRFAVESLHSRLDAQSDTIAALEVRLRERNDEAEELERMQNRLGLLFWTMARFGGDNNEVYETLIQLTNDKGFKDAADIAGARLHNLAAAAVAHITGDQFRRRAKKSVQRGLYSLLMAGGMIFSLPEESSVATAIPAELTRPEEIVNLVEAEPIGPNIPTGPVFSGYVGRPFDISFLPPWEKAKGFDFIQQAIVREIDALAQNLGIEPEAYLILVKRLFSPGQTVSLHRLQAPDVSFQVLKWHFPHVAGDFKDIPLKPSHMGALYKMAAQMAPDECLFWDRLYADYRALNSESAESLGMILKNMDFHRENNAAGAREFAGRLKPIPELEKLGLAGFTKVITPYFRANIKAFTSHPAFSYAHKAEEIDEYARRLAQDMFISAKLFGVPRTLMISIAHQESYFANVLGDNSMSASPFQIYNPTKPLIIKSMNNKGLAVPGVPQRLQDNLTLATYMAANHLSDLMDKSSRSWAKGKKLLCDLDRVALSYNGGEAYPPAVYGKKVRLMGYLDRIRKGVVQKKQRPRA